MVARSQTLAVHDQYTALPLLACPGEKLEQSLACHRHSHTVQVEPGNSGILAATQFAHDESTDSRRQVLQFFAGIEVGRVVKVGKHVLTDVLFVGDARGRQRSGRAARWLDPAVVQAANSIDGITEQSAVFRRESSLCAHSLRHCCLRRDGRQVSILRPVRPLPSASGRISGLIRTLGAARL